MMGVYGEREVGDTRIMVFLRVGRGFRQRVHMGIPRELMGVVRDGS